MKKKKRSKKTSGTLAIAALLLNILVLPGLGTLIAGEKNKGVLQLILFVAGVFLIFTLFGAIVGVLLMIAMWVWALITGIQIVKEAS